MTNSATPTTPNGMPFNRLFKRCLMPSGTRAAAAWAACSEAATEAVMVATAANANAGGGGGRGGMFGQPSPEAEALQKAIDDNAPKAQIKTALAKYQASQKAKRDKLVQAQENLRKYLNTKQEAQATLLGLLE